LIPLPSIARLFRFFAIGLVFGISVSLAWVCVAVISRPEIPFTNLANGFVGNDFVALYAGAVLASDGRPEQAYDPQALHSVEMQVAKSPNFPFLPMAYPPFFQLVIMPLGNLEYLTAYRVWVGLTFVLLIVVAWQISPHWHTLVLVPIFPAVVFCAAAGQNGNLSAAILGSGLLLLPRNPVAAGIAFGLMAYKPHLALAIPFCLLAGRHYRALAATATTAFATVLASVIGFGFAPILAFLPSLQGQFQLFFGARQTIVWRRMPTVLVTVLQLTDSMFIALAVHVLVAASALAVVTWVWRQCDDQCVRSWSLVASIPLLTPYFIDYDLAIFAIPFVFLCRESRLAGFAGAIVVAAALWLAQPVTFLLPVLLPAIAPYAPKIAPLLWASLVVSSALRVRQRNTESGRLAPP
jgi:alpha-1,2-mannosyltransferase